MSSVPLVSLDAQYASMRDEIDTAVLDVVRAQRFILGPVVDEFEQEVASYVGSKHAIGCASGTDAILLALKALRLEPGSGVVVPSFTFFATAGAVWNAGLRPIFADIDERTFNVTADTMEAALTDEARALVPVHLYGQMADLTELMPLAQKRGLPLIEDAAQCFGAQQRVDGEWRMAGAVGTMGCYSYFPAKVLGGFGDGGMIVTDDDDLALLLRKLRVHGGQRMYHHEMVGTNSRLDTLQAAVLRTKLPWVDRWVAGRQANAEAYNAAFADLAPRVVTPLTLDHNRHAFGVYTLIVEDRDALKAHLDEAGVGNAVYYPVPLHLQECFAELGYRPGSLPVTERLAGRVLSLPVYPELSVDQRDRVIEAVRDFYAGA